MAANEPPRGSDTKPSRRVPVERMLPEDVRASIHAAVLAAPSVDAAFVERLDREHDLSGRFDLSKRRLRLFVKRTWQRYRSASGETAPPDEDDEACWRRRIAGYRRRQASVAAVLDQTFGVLAASNPDLWERRAYLMLVGLVYERLATHEDDISTDELVALAKILAEHRRANGRAQGPAAERVLTTAQPVADRLPPYFATLVRQIYGVHLETPGEDSAEPAQEPGSGVRETEGGGVGG